MSSASTRIPASAGRWDSIIYSSPIGLQYSFMLSLTGIGWTESFGTAVVRSILGPLLMGRKVCLGLRLEGLMGGHNRPYPSPR